MSQAPAPRLDKTLLTPGSGETSVDLDDVPLPVYTYLPQRLCGGILILFDGLHRNCAELRDKAIALAERTGLIAFSPLFDRERFPKWRYDTAGVVQRDTVQPRSQWTGPQVQKLIEQLRGLAGAASTPVYLFGHSAGGQLLSRVCAYSPLSDTHRIVITNPSAWVLPDLDEAVPFGFDGLFTPEEAVARLQVYLALPVTIYLGQQDTGKRHLVSKPQARRQGVHRLARGRNVFNAARAVAQRNGWACNWRLVEVPGIGHSSRAMLKAAQCVEALGIAGPAAD